MEGETSNLFTLSSAARWKLMEIAPIYWFAHPQKAKHTGQVINSSGAPAVSNSSLRLKVAASSVSAASDRKKLKQVLPPLTVTLIGLCCMSHALRCLLRNHVLLLHFLILFTIFAHARHTPSFAETMSEQETIPSIPKTTAFRPNQAEEATSCRLGELVCQRPEQILEE